MTALITGFERFGGHAFNTSGLVVEALEAVRAPGLVTAVLPTSYRRAGVRIRELVRHHRPAIVLMLGHDGGAERLRLESRARNLDDCDAPDNDGETRTGRRIDETGPAEYPSTLDLGRMAEIAAARGETADISGDAGGYVCNHIFYAAAHLMTAELPASRYAFAHLPPTAGRDERLARFSEIVRIWTVEG